MNIKPFQDFLDSLSTKGGNILMMFVCLVSLTAFVHHLGTDPHVDPSIISATHDMMVGFGAALLAVLSGSSSRQQMADRVETTVAGQRVEVSKTDTVNISENAKP